MWVVLITGSCWKHVSDMTGLHYVLFVLSNYHALRRDLMLDCVALASKRNRFSITFTFSHHCPSHPGKFIGQRNCGDLCVFAFQ